MTIIDFFKKLLNGILLFLFPNFCPFCDEILDGNKLICSRCFELVKFHECCNKCGMPIRDCRCRIKKFFFDGCVSCCEYKGIVRRGVLQFKYHFAHNCAEYICIEVLDKLEKYGYSKHIDIVTAVPMTRKRMLKTGYNQAEIIAKILADGLKKPCNFKLLKKNWKYDKRQHEQDKVDRKRLAILSYSIRKKHKDISGKAILLCDDITTTGSTLSQCAKLLKEMGAAKVYCAVLASTPTKKTDKEDK